MQRAGRMGDVLRKEEENKAPSPSFAAIFRRSGGAEEVYSPQKVGEGKQGVGRKVQKMLGGGEEVGH